MTESGDTAGVWDADRLAQVLANLVSNAFRHGASGGTVQIALCGGDDDVLLSVHNDGEPIPPETLPHVFDPFRQGRGEDRARKQREGLGLGLFIVREITRARGGTVRVTSDVASGTELQVRLPRRPPHA